MHRWQQLQWTLHFNRPARKKKKHIRQLALAPPASLFQHLTIHDWRPWHALNLLYREFWRMPGVPTERSQFQKILGLFELKCSWSLAFQRWWWHTSLDWIWLNSQLLHPCNQVKKWEVRSHCKNRSTGKTPCWYAGHLSLCKSNVVVCAGSPSAWKNNGLADGTHWGCIGHEVHGSRGSRRHHSSSSGKWMTHLLCSEQTAAWEGLLHSRHGRHWHLSGKAVRNGGSFWQSWLLSYVYTKAAAMPGVFAALTPNYETTHLRFFKFHQSN